MSSPSENIEILPNILIKVLFVFSVGFPFEDTIKVACCEREEPGLEEMNDMVSTWPSALHLNGLI